MPQDMKVGRVMVTVADQDAAIAFYTDKLGFKLTADTPFGEGDRWVEVEPPGGGVTLALVPPRNGPAPGQMTNIALDVSDGRATQDELKSKGVDVDEEYMGGDGTVPLLFFFRDQDGNTLMVVEQAPA
jgi:catechol 2,3-dioxygenase-like lactoylglutathione lyase family enzyme